MQATRGYGFLEGYLAQKRVQMANRLIPKLSRTGKLLDIGCGTHPFFLLNTEFYEKHGLDKSVQLDKQYLSGGKRIIVNNFDIEEDAIPYGNDSFDVVTMLAVLEHLTPHCLVDRMKEIRRVLKPGGLFIITTPAVWTDLLLKVLAKLRIVSPIEVQEHKAAYSHHKVNALLDAAGYTVDNIRGGFFECYMNLWVVARKSE